MQFISSTGYWVFKCCLVVKLCKLLSQKHNVKLLYVWSLTKSYLLTYLLYENAVSITFDHWIVYMSCGLSWVLDACQFHILSAFRPFYIILWVQSVVFQDRYFRVVFPKCLQRFHICWVSNCVSKQVNGDLYSAKPWNGDTSNALMSL